MSSFQFKSAPTQCNSVTIEVIGKGGKPPYKLALIPVVNSKARWSYLQFDASPFTLPTLQWPAGSQFVALMSDQRGIGSIGTSLPISVASSSSVDCLGGELPVYFQWKTSGVAQCKTASFTVNSTYPNSLSPPLHMWVVFPGGRSFAANIPDGSVVPGAVSTFPFFCNMRGGSQVIFVLGDERVGITSTSTIYSIQDSDDSSCIGPSSPALTPTPAAGQVVEGFSGGGESSGHPGAIAGGVVGGVVIMLSIVAFILYLKRRRAARADTQAARVDLDGTAATAPVEPYVYTQANTNSPLMPDATLQYDPYAHVQPVSNATNTASGYRSPSAPSGTERMSHSSADFSRTTPSAQALQPSPLVVHGSQWPSQESKQSPPPYSR